MDFIYNMYDNIKTYIYDDKKNEFKKPNGYKNINTSSIKLKN